MKYFTNVKTLEELRKEYKNLLKKFHPDNQNGSEEICKEINIEYDIVLERIKNGFTYENTSENYSSKFNNMFKDIISKIININADIEIIGSWIWVTGNTFPYKDLLKTLGFKWCNNKKAWTFHELPSTNRKKMSMEKIRSIYGSETVKIYDATKKQNSKKLAMA